MKFSILVLALAILNVYATNQLTNNASGSSRKSNRVNLLSQAINARMLAASNPQLAASMDTTGGFVPIQRAIPTMIDMTTSRPIDVRGFDMNSFMIRNQPQQQQQQTTTTRTIQQGNMFGQQTGMTQQQFGMMGQQPAQQQQQQPMVQPIMQQNNMMQTQPQQMQQSPRMGQQTGPAIGQMGQMGQQQMTGQMGQQTGPAIGQMGQMGQQQMTGQMGQQQMPGQMGQQQMPGQMGQQQMTGQMGQQQMPGQMGQLGQQQMRPTMNQTIPVQPISRAPNDLCSTNQAGDIIAHPSNPTQFVICYGFGEFTVMDCPEHLVYNPHLIRCDLDTSVPPGCSSNPCLNNGKCIDLPQLFTFRCECPSGFTGQTCEKVDTCSTKPCGPDGVCISMAAGSPVPNVCMCNSGRTIGTSCNQQSVEMNPCFQPNSNLKQFPTRVNPSVFIQCEGLRPHFVFCQFPLVYSPARQACDWTSQ